LWSPDNGGSNATIASPTSRDPSNLRTSLVARLAVPFGLVALLLIEIVYLTVRFDTEVLQNESSVWARAIGWTPQLLRLAIAIAGATLLFTGSELWTALRAGELSRRPSAVLRRLPYQLLSFAAFFRITAVVMSGQLFSRDYPEAWILLWVLTGFATLVSWTVALLPVETWKRAAKTGRLGILCGVVAGSIAWLSSFAAMEFWTPLARVTFQLVARLLASLYSQTTIDPVKLIIGTPKFKVEISPQCSGYEGIGLILAFLSVYVWISRKHLRFPSALLLFPFGAAVIWILNIFRIAALVVIGSSGWPDIARGGFHSQAGWLSFSGVALGLVALTTRRGYFMKPMERQTAVVGVDPTAAYLAPFLAIIASAMITGAFSAGFDYLYGVRVIAVVGVLWIYRRSYADLKWRWSWEAIGIGAITFAIWLAMTPAGVNPKSGWPAALQAMPSGWSGIWLFMRVVGYVATVPIAEELAFRGFLTRRIVRPDFQNLPPGSFTWASFLISSILFGAMHGAFWLGGTIAGILFAIALYRRRRLCDAVLAHATTNALIAVYVLITGRWSVWS
jgi:exosortase E/protease (VPEID-CTERM system)